MGPGGVDVFHYSDAREYLRACFEDKQKRNPRFSLRSWARSLELKSPAALSLILAGKRRIPSKLAHKLGRNLGLSQEQLRYFNFLLLHSRSKTEDERAFCSEFLTRLKPDKDFREIRLDQFKLIADWYHLTILEMTHLKDFVPDPLWISRRLGGKVSPAEVQAAVLRLFRMGLLKAANGTWRKTDSMVKVGDLRLKSEAIRKFHEQMIGYAQKSIQEQSTEDRDLSGRTVTISKARMAEARELIRKFRDEFAKLVEDPNGDETYQLNVQFYKLTAGDPV